MSQLSLFDTQKPAVERRPPNPVYIRKHLARIVKTLRDAERMPWSEAEARSWEALFPQLAALLEQEEGGALLATFESELLRLRQVR